MCVCMCVGGGGGGKLITPMLFEMKVVYIHTGRNIIYGIETVI